MITCKTIKKVLGLSNQAWHNRLKRGYKWTFEEVHKVSQEVDGDLYEVFLEMEGFKNV